MPWRRVVVSLQATLADAFADALMDSGALAASIEQDRSAGQAEHALFGEPGDVDDMGPGLGRIVWSTHYFPSSLILKHWLPQPALY